MKEVPQQSPTKSTSTAIISPLNIKSSCQVWWHWECSRDCSCHTVTLADDLKQNRMAFEKNCPQSRMPLLSKVSTFQSTVEASICTRNKLYVDDPNE